MAGACADRRSGWLGSIGDIAPLGLSTGRHQGKPYAWRLMQMLRHVTEHGSQIRQFITTTGISADAGAI